MRFSVILFAAALLVPSPASAVGGAGASLRGMAAVPGGMHARLYAVAGLDHVRVKGFALDRDPVTRGNFLRFVQASPSWRRSMVKASSAGRGYLMEWRGDLDAGTAAELRLPVTSVSWFAARAYCEAQGKRLPTVDEWEYAAAASETRADAARDPGFIKRILGLYASRAGKSPRPVGTGFRNLFGVRGLHDHNWEWTADFKPDRSPGAGHHHDASGSKHEHDMFCASAAIGAADPSNYPAFMRYAVRAGLTREASLRTLGFRCAGNLPA